MHELSVTESILAIALRHAGQAEAKRVTELNLVIGQLATIVDDSVQFYWDIISENTIAEGASLHFRRLPLELLCQLCGACYTPGAEILPAQAAEVSRSRLFPVKNFILNRSRWNEVGLI